MNGVNPNYSMNQDPQQGGGGFNLSGEAPSMMKYHMQNQRGSSGTFNYGNISPFDDQFSSKTFANIINQEYQDYLQRFNPYEKRMLSLAESRELLDEQLGRITTNVNSSFSKPSMNAGALQQQRYGVQASGQQQQHQSKQNDMNRALSTTHARNNTRVADGDRRMGLITGTDSSRANVMRQTQGG